MQETHFVDTGLAEDWEFVSLFRPAIENKQSAG